MGSEAIRYLILPGWQGSPEVHWQSHWQRSLPNSMRVEQADWLQPRRARLHDGLLGDADHLLHDRLKGRFVVLE